MLKGMTSEELSEWYIIHTKLSPFGDYRSDLRTGMAVAPLVNLLKAALQKDPKFSKPSDWLLDLCKAVEPAKPQSMAEMKAVFKAIADEAKREEEERKKRVPKKR
jgi:hypothetical protein